MSSHASSTSFCSTSLLLLYYFRQSFILSFSPFFSAYLISVSSSFPLLLLPTPSTPSSSCFSSPCCFSSCPFLRSPESPCRCSSAPLLWELRRLFQPLLLPGRSRGHPGGRSGGSCPGYSSPRTQARVGAGGAAGGRPAAHEGDRGVAVLLQMLSGLAMGLC